MAFNIGSPKVEQRRKHWEMIRTRVKTHEGEFLHGEKGRDYQVKYSRKYLGKDLSSPIKVEGEAYERELRKA